MSESPRYRHDCDSCIYLGAFGRFDLWHCPHCDGGSVIARYGDEGAQYASGPINLWRNLATTTPDVLAMQEGIRRIDARILEAE